jgi:hypothetical protein
MVVMKDNNNDEDNNLGLPAALQVSPEDRARGAARAVGGSTFNEPRPPGVQQRHKGSASYKSPLL